MINKQWSFENEKKKEAYSIKQSKDNPEQGLQGPKIYRAQKYTMDMDDIKINSKEIVYARKIKLKYIL